MSRDPLSAEERAAFHQAFVAVEGWLSESEGELLYRLARRCRPPGVIVEIGSWKGRSTICLAKGSLAGSRVPVYAIDPHTGSPEHRREFGEVWTLGAFRANVRGAGVEEIVRPLVQTSEEAARDFTESVALIFIDGPHEYEAVRRDFEAWFCKVAEGGVMAFHDTSYWNGPGRLMGERVFPSRHFRRAGWVDSITFAEKVATNMLRDRVANRWTWLYKSIRERVSRWLGRADAVERERLEGRSHREGAGRGCDGRGHG